jgi:hypothetical protein
MMTIEAATASRGGRWFWPAWGAAFLGFPVGGTAATALVGPVDTVAKAALAGAVAGAVLGAAQWLLLRQRLPVPAWWVAATGGGMAVGMALGAALLGDETAGAPLLLRGLVTGAAIGVAQTALGRRAAPGAPVWGLAVAVGWPLGWAITRAVGVDLEWKWAVFGSSGALAFQLLTGLALAYVQRVRAADG